MSFVNRKNDLVDSRHSGFMLKVAFVSMGLSAGLERSRARPHAQSRAYYRDLDDAESVTVKHLAEAGPIPQFRPQLLELGNYPPSCAGLYA
jgi:hypothetical protein